jgi:hypothetical protein
MMRAKKEKLKAAIQMFQQELVATDAILTHHGTEAGGPIFIWQCS